MVQFLLPELEDLAASVAVVVVVVGLVEEVVVAAGPLHGRELRLRTGRARVDPLLPSLRWENRRLAGTRRVVRGVGII